LSHSTLIRALCFVFALNFSSLCTLQVPTGHTLTFVASRLETRFSAAGRGDVFCGLHIIRGDFLQNPARLVYCRRSHYRSSAL